MNESSYNTIDAGNPVVTPFTMTTTGIANVQDVDNPVNTVLVLKRSREETKPHLEQRDPVTSRWMSPDNG